MTHVYGLFETEHRVAEAIQALRNVGYDRERISLIVSNDEVLNELAAETDIAIQETHRALDDRPGNPILWTAAMGTPNASNVSGLDGNGLGTPIAPLAWTEVNANDRAISESGLQRLGLPDDEAEKFGGYVDQGYYLLKVDIEEERPEDVEQMLRQCDAMRVDIHH